jgi:hypothetical protein
MKRKRTWSVVTVSAIGIVSASAALGLTAANASQHETAAHASAARPAVRVADTRDTTRLRLLTRDREKAELAARRAKVVKAVLAKFPHARILRIALHKNGVWVVTLQLKDHKVGFVTVDKHLRVSKFTRLVKRDADTAMRRPSGTVIMSNTPFMTGQHW